MQRIVVSCFLQISSLMKEGRHESPCKNVGKKRRFVSRWRVKQRFPPWATLERIWREAGMPYGVSPRSFAFFSVFAAEEAEVRR
jgi:hypothetical protein